MQHYKELEYVTLDQEVTDIITQTLDKVRKCNNRMNRQWLCNEIIKAFCDIDNQFDLSKEMWGYKI